MLRDLGIKDYLTTASDGKKNNVICYSLEMILAIGYRIRSMRGVQFQRQTQTDRSRRSGCGRPDMAGGFAESN